MADIRPFKAIRPAAEKTAQVAALPYDVYNRAEAREAVCGKPDSFLNIDRPETNMAIDADMYGEEAYKTARALFDHFLKAGIFLQDNQVAYYIYALTMDGRTQTGIVAASSVDDYVNGVIMKHENTRAEKEADRIRHVDALSAQTGPIFLAYRRHPGIAQVVARVKQEAPLFDFVSEDGIRHQGWCICEAEEIEAVQKGFEEISEIYIADGHHRAASAVKVGLSRREAHPGYTGEEEFNYFLSVLFPDEELMILPYNRVLRSLKGETPATFMKKVEEIFDVTPSAIPVDPQEKASFGMYLGKQWYLLKTKPAYLSEDPVDGLDVSILQNHILEPVLGIEDPKTDHDIDFVGGIRGIKELEKRCEEDCVLAFSMYPTSIGELFAVADAGKLMPPKSTWFEPKLRSGLFIHQIEEA